MSQKTAKNDHPRVVLSDIMMFHSKQVTSVILDTNTIFMPIFQINLNVKNGFQMFASWCIKKVMEQNVQKVFIFGPCIASILNSSRP